MENKLPPVPVSPTGLFQPHESGWFIDLISGDGVSPASFADQPAGTRLIIAICAYAECENAMHPSDATGWTWWENAAAEWGEIEMKIREEMKS